LFGDNAIYYFAFLASFGEPIGTQKSSKVDKPVSKTYKCYDKWYNSNDNQVKLNTHSKHWSITSDIRIYYQRTFLTHLYKVKCGYIYHALYFTRYFFDMFLYLSTRKVEFSKPFKGCCTTNLGSTTLSSPVCLYMTYAIVG
jgi:hypothetical protein